MDQRSRKQNWSEHETIILLEAIEPRYARLFGKFSAKLTAKDKNSLWENIAQELAPRSVDEIKRKFSKVKSEKLILYSKFKRNSQGTGGGPPPRDPSPVTMKIIALVGGEDNPKVLGLQSGMDTSAMVDVSSDDNENDDSDTDDQPSKRRKLIHGHQSTADLFPNPKPAIDTSKRPVKLQEQLVQQNEKEHELRMRLLHIQIENEEKKRSLLSKKLERYENQVEFTADGNRYLNL